MKCPLNHKTIVLVDHSVRMGQYSNDFVEMEYLSRMKTSSAASLLPPGSVTRVAPTLWTVAWEMLLEYSRVVFDLFPGDKLLRFLISDQESPTFLNSWSLEEQSTTFLTESLLKVGPPSRQGRCPEDGSDWESSASLSSSLKAAVEALIELTDAQENVVKSSGSYSRGFVNRGRIICFTTSQPLAVHRSQDGNEKYDVLGIAQPMFSKLESELEKCLMSANKSVPFSHHPGLASPSSMEVDGDSSPQKAEAASATRMALETLEFVVVNLTPLSRSGALRTASIVVGPQQSSPLLNSIMHVIPTDTRLPRETYQLAFRHYGLASTTVTGIPMKEETSSSASMNYDVELLHDATAHSVLPVPSPQRRASDGATCLDYPSTTLKWVLPRAEAGAQELQLCSSLHRVTTVDVNGRPSVCLTNFILSGRTVNLEYTPPQAEGSSSAKKFQSHSLCAHGGEIFIQTLFPSRSVIEDPPSVSDGPGGKVTDYRVTELSNSCRNSFLLAPWPRDKTTYPWRFPPQTKVPVDRCKTLASQATVYYPLTLGSSALSYVGSHVEPLFNLLFKDELSADDTKKCKEVFETLTRLDENDEIAVPNVSKHKLKVEKIKSMWFELETLLRSHCRSLSHQAVLDAFYDVRNKEMDVDQAMMEFDRYTAMTEQEKRDYERRVGGPTPPKRKKEDPPLSAAGGGAKGKSGSLIGGNAGLNNLYSLWKMNLEKEIPVRKDFVGRLASVGGIGQLYTKVEAKTKQLEKTSSAPNSGSTVNGKAA